MWLFLGAVQGYPAFLREEASERIVAQGNAAEIVMGRRVEFQTDLAITGRVGETVELSGSGSQYKFYVSKVGAGVQVHSDNGVTEFTPTTPGTYQIGSYARV